MVAEIGEAGYAVLPGVVDADRVAAIRSATAELAAAEAGTPADASYHGGASQRVFALVAKHPLFADVAVESVVLEVVEAVIGVRPILSNLSANIVGTGGRMMAIHADQGFVPGPWPAPWGVQVMWALDDFSEGRGATRAVPGSHLHQGRPERAVAHRDTVPVTAPPGSLLFFDARTWHGTGVFTDEVTDPADRRHALLAFYTMPFLRAQENWGLSVGPERFRDRPDLQHLLGITPWEHLGLVAGQAWRGPAGEAR